MSEAAQAQCHQALQYPDTGLCAELRSQDITLLPHSGMFISFTRSGCLSWSVGEMTEGANVVLAVAGQDYSTMWSLEAAVSEDSIVLEPGLGRRIRSLAVFTDN